MIKRLVVVLGLVAGSMVPAAAAYAADIALGPCSEADVKVETTTPGGTTVRVCAKYP